MYEKVDLLTKNNITRHLQKKISNMSEIATLVKNKQNPLILNSLLPLALSYFEAAIIDTIKEYLLARPYEILTLDVVKEILNDKHFMQKRNNFEEKQLKEYILKEYVLKIENKCHKDKLKKLGELLQIKIYLGGKDWGQIKESIARRNCLIHNDLIANETYFKQAGAFAKKELQIDNTYLTNLTKILKSFLSNIQQALKNKYSSYTSIKAIKRLWEYLFKGQYLLNFSDCWMYKNGNGYITYKGPKLKDLEDCHSPRTICLFSAWMSFFRGGDLKHFSTIFYVNEKDRKIYLKKLIFLMECFEKIDFQLFKVKVYRKP